MMMMVVEVVGGVGADGGADFHRYADFDEDCQTIIILRQMLLLDIPVMDFFTSTTYFTSVNISTTTPGLDDKLPWKDLF